jgi:hypothetical protein
MDNESHLALRCIFFNSDQKELGTSLSFSSDNNVGNMIQ